MQRMKWFKKVIEYLFVKGGLWGYFFLTFFGILLVSFAKLKISKDLYYILLVIFLLGYLYLSSKIIHSIYKLFQEIKLLVDFKITSKKEEQKKRAEIAVRLVAITYCLTIVISFLFSGSDKIFGIDILNGLLCLFGSMLIVYIIIRFISVFSTTILIFASTLLGFVTLFLVISFLFSIIPYLINKGPINSMPLLDPSLKGSFLCIIVLIPKFYSYIWIGLAVSVFIQTLIILLRPAYTLPVTKVSFKFIGIVIPILAVLLLLFTQEIKDYLNGFISTFKFKPEDLLEIKRLFGNVINPITDSYVQRMITIVFLPYTIGTYISLFIIEIKENKNKIKAKNYYYLALYNHLNGIETDNLYNLRRCLFFGGDAFELSILNTPEFESYLNSLGYVERMIESTQKKQRLKTIFNFILKKVRNILPL